MYGSEHFGVWALKLKQHKKRALLPVILLFWSDWNVIRLSRKGEIKHCRAFSGSHARGPAAFFWLTSRCKLDIFGFFDFWFVHIFTFFFFLAVSEAACFIGCGPCEMLCSPTFVWRVWRQCNNLKVSAFNWYLHLIVSILTFTFSSCINLWTYFMIARLKRLSIWLHIN